MNVIVKTEDATEELFRKSDQLRGEFKTFIEGGCGSVFLFLLKERAKIRAKKEAVPHDAIATYSIAELSRLAGLQEAVDLINELCGIPATQTKGIVMPHLGRPTENDPNLPAKFEVAKPTKATP